MAKSSHEKKVEKFYSHGTEKRHAEADGFLSFGYRTEKTKGYLEAAENLLQYVLENAKIENAKNILNVACGYGAETFRLFKSILPEKIFAIDITQDHITYANKKAKELHLDKNIIFEHKDACNIDHPDNTFSHVFGVEGPAHFNTRQKFFEEAYRVLEEKGSLILTDIIVKTEWVKKNFFTKLFAKFGSYGRRMPKANRGGVDVYKKQLEDIGFTVEYIQEIGANVYKGFATCNLQRKSIVNAIKTRGFFTGIGLTCISRILRYSHKIGGLEYIHVKATK